VTVGATGAPGVPALPLPPPQPLNIRTVASSVAGRIECVFIALSISLNDDIGIGSQKSNIAIKFTDRIV
jgi:hypothetical protein